MAHDGSSVGVVRLKANVGSLLKAGARIVLMTAVLLVVLVMFFEHRFLFYPEREIAATPSIPYEDVNFQAADGTMLHGWFLPASGSRIWILSHGNAGNVGDRAVMAEFLIQEFGASVFMYDYRGYGRSEGRPSETGTYADIRGAYDWVLQRGYTPGDVVLFGQSLGTAVTLDLATEFPVSGVVLEAPFTSVPDMGRHRFGIPLEWLLDTRYDSASKIASVDAPVAIVHARRDPIVPFALGEALYDAASTPKRFFAVEGEIHEGVTMGMGVEALGDLWQFLTQRPPG